MDSRPLSLLLLGLLAQPARAAPWPATPTGVVAIYWEPPGAPPLGRAVRAAFLAAVVPLRARIVDARPPVLPVASLRPALEAAQQAYGRFEFAAAIAHLDELQRLADARGGGDLDARQLSEIFFFRGLCRLEAGTADAAWDDLVRAARLDPTRIVDPARFPPRAVSAFKRAVAEVAQATRAELQIDAPPAALVRIDGAAGRATATLPLGPHFVAVVAEGYEPWAGVVAIEGARERFVAPLHRYQPPDGDQLLALAGAQGTRNLVLGALLRDDAGWRFVARDVTLPEGKFVSDAVALGDAPAAPLVEGLVRRLVPATAIAPPQAPPPRRLLWPWLVGAGAAVTAAAGVAIGVVAGSAVPSGVIGGNLGQF